MTWQISTSAMACVRSTQWTLGTWDTRALGRWQCLQTTLLGIELCLDDLGLWEDGGICFAEHESAGARIWMEDASFGFWDVGRKLLNEVIF